MKFLNYVLVIIILGMGVSQLKSCVEIKRLNTQIADRDRIKSSLNKKIELEAKIISRDVDKFGLQHVTIDAAEKLFPKDILKNPIAVSPGIIDTTAMALNIQKNQIQQLTIINSSLKADNLKAERTLDSLKKEVFTYSDKYVKLKFNPADTTKKTDATFDFSYNATLNSVQYWKRKFPIIGAKKSYIDIWSEDKRTTINSVKRLTIEQKAPEFGLRLQLRSIYSLTSHKLYAGPGVSFDFNRYSLLGYSYYNFSNNTWQYSVGINYDLIRF